MASELIQKLINVAPSLSTYSKISIPLILDECKRQGITNKAQIAYILATVRHESKFGKSMFEIGKGDAKTYFNQKYSKRTDLGNQGGNDGYNFRGRGYVQITGRGNYKHFSKIAGLDLIANPDRAADRNIAAKILVYGMKTGEFTWNGRNLNKFINDTQIDFVNARRIINGTDQAQTIAGYAEEYYGVLKNSNLEKKVGGGIVASLFFLALFVARKFFGSDSTSN